MLLILNALSQTQIKYDTFTYAFYTADHFQENLFNKYSLKEPEYIVNKMSVCIRNTFIARYTLKIKCCLTKSYTNLNMLLFYTMLPSFITHRQIKFL